MSSIVEGVNEQNSIVNHVCADDWTVEMSTIASNVNSKLNLFGTHLEAMSFSLSHSANEP